MIFQLMCYCLLDNYLISLYIYRIRVWRLRYLSLDWKSSAAVLNSFWHILVFTKHREKLNQGCIFSQKIFYFPPPILENLFYSPRKFICSTPNHQKSILKRYTPEFKWGWWNIKLNRFTEEWLIGPALFLSPFVTFCSKIH